MSVCSFYDFPFPVHRPYHAWQFLTTPVVLEFRLVLSEDGGPEDGRRPAW